MICVFFQYLITGVQAATSAPLQARAAPSAEIVNTVEWIMVN